jgi:3-deoxy-D-manno-octulosonic acid kinase
LDETVVKSETGVILYDRSIINQISEACFSPQGWSSALPIEGRLRSAGRGPTLAVADGNREFVLKHYLRGGLIGRVNRDRYLWQGEDRTRAFAEWRLLRKMVAMGLPVPQPAAGFYRRRGWCYTADLLTVKATGISPLSARIARGPTGPEFWRGIGRGIRRFHDAGVYHADLNAYNVQVDRQDGVFLLDFDRGAIRRPGRWQEANLARLHRSLAKLKRLDSGLEFGEAHWSALEQGYSRRSA